MQQRRLKRGQYVLLECQHFVAEGLGLSYFADAAERERFKPEVFFIWGVLPQEKFIARLAQVKSKIAYGILAERAELPSEWHNHGFAHPRWALLTSSPERREPECSNFLHCGGCRLQHMDYARTLQYKSEWLHTQLVRNHVHVENLFWQDLPESARRHYRNHVQVHINKDGVYGFYEPFSYRVRGFPEEGCQIFAEKALRPHFPQFPKEVRAVRIRVDGDGSAVFTVLNSAQDKSAQATYHVTWPQGRTVKICFPVQAFFQANLQALPFWLDTIHHFFERAGIQNPRVLEIFSGFGFISRMLQRVFPLEVMGLDILKPEQVAQVEFWENGVRLPDRFSSHFRSVDLFLPERIPQDLLFAIAQFRPQLLLINPPRAGLTAPTWQKLKTALADFSGPIVYSSCDAATMARDLAIFAQDGYRCVEMRAFDFFPWTQHYETVSLLLKAPETI
ncbi:MAG: hypothetical protein N2Z22_04280 [Turneriella sp.]|nr:hypothetical protein [Turneriella sp.]